jgi:predicted Zn-dependent protease
MNTHPLNRYPALQRSRLYPAIAVLIFALCCSLFLIVLSLPSSATPPPATHPLPSALANWRDRTHAGDYFAQIQPSSAGYLVWSSFPITVYIQPPSPAEVANPFTAQRSRVWIAAVQTAIQDWQPYLPLKQVEQAAGADITIGRSPQALRLEKDPKSGKFNLPRARSAETRFEFYAKQPPANAAPILAHRMTITIRPDQAPDYLQAAARHELGHAIGIWGHSPNPSDALYYSQVRNPAQISPRDINTLKRIYEQPTRLGWQL